MLFVNSNGRVVRVRYNNGNARPSQKSFRTKDVNIINRYSCDPKGVLRVDWTNSVFPFVFEEEK